jgi:hypothetical protein
MYWLPKGNIEAKDGSGNWPVSSFLETIPKSIWETKMKACPGHNGSLKKITLF